MSVQVQGWPEWGLGGQGRIWSLRRQLGFDGPYRPGSAGGDWEVAGLTSVILFTLSDAAVAPSRFLFGELLERLTC